MENNVFSRRISPSEWSIMSCPEWALPTIQLVVEGVGSLDPDELTSAVAAAADAVPGSRLRRRGKFWVARSAPPPVQVIEETLDRHGFANAGPMRRSLSSEDGPTCEVVLFAGDPITVVFRAFHGCMDGNGVRQWVSEVFRALRKEAPIGAPDRITETELLDRLGVTVAEPASAVFEQRPGWPSALGHRHTDQGLLWRRRSIDGNQPALVAKLAKAITEEMGLPAGRFLVPVNLRRHDPTIRSTANLSLVVHLDVEAGRPWEESYERLLTMLEREEELTTRTDPAQLELSMPALRAHIEQLDTEVAANDAYGAIALLSHIARIDLADFSAGDFRASSLYALPNAGPLTAPEFIMLESQGRTEITVGWFDGPGVADRAERMLDRIEETLSPAAHRHWAGNATARELPAGQTALSLFAERVAEAPEAVALSGPEGDLSYRELDRRSDAVAADLARRGIGRGAVVGVLADRTPATVAGLFGVLKAGAAYLPLDPGHPDRRISALLAEVAAPACLFSAAGAGRDCLPDGCAAVHTESLPAGDRPPSRVEPGDLAYVIYTSGSTGRPKGVEIEHGALANYASWAIRRFGIDAGSHFALFTSLAFDLPNSALFPPLLAGGRITLVPEEPNHLSLQRMIEDSGVNSLKLTPSHVDLIDRIGIRPSGFRLVLIGGEQLRVPVAQAALRLFGPDCRVANHYGPTEATVGCLAYPLDPGWDDSGTSVPIGTPADNTRVFLLDGEGRFAAPGDPGELCIAGAQLARGYHGRPDLTRERFTRLADGTRVYRTGDLARLLPSGVIESLGRNDDQLKVNGYRVEPAEVARALESHPAVRRAVVTGRVKPGTEDKLLCAYVLAEPAPIAEELDAHVASLLPRHMVPAATLVVPELPSTRNGKVDLSALPDPFGTPDTPPRTAEARDEVEAAVAEIWARLLEIDADQIRPESDFHRLGGNSVNMLAMLAHVSKGVAGGGRAGRRLMTKFPEIIRQPTCGAICDLVRKARDEN
jgi:amino acid adenylation domain-containing protein